MITFAAWRAQGAKGEFFWRNTAKNTISEFTYRSSVYQPWGQEEVETWEGYSFDELPIQHGQKKWFLYRPLPLALRLPPGGLAEVMAEVGLTDETLGATSLEELLLHERNSHAQQQYSNPNSNADDTQRTL